ncbi:uncharacterized protein LOC106088864 [Stomoxys calcitrans]|uniref:uncharacterized protein LOC106088864 n=1 Tax=Stomoxys calcitrans TaxID=35570 RepID=UPI0027E2E621|nr:uncharacterized protein LOC106088864 [Stomoxys calcitrans]
MAKTVDVYGLIEEIRLRPVLWDLKHEQNSNRAVVQNCWENIAKILKADVRICKGRWRTLRDTHSALQRRGVFNMKRRWRYLDALYFLNGQERKRKRRKGENNADDLLASGDSWEGNTTTYNGNEAAKRKVEIGDKNSLNSILNGSDIVEHKNLNEDYNKFYTIFCDEEEQRREMDLMDGLIHNDDNAFDDLLDISEDSEDMLPTSHNIWDRSGVEIVKPIDKDTNNYAQPPHKECPKASSDVNIKRTFADDDSINQSSHSISILRKPKNVYNSSASRTQLPTKHVHFPENLGQARVSSKKPTQVHANNFSVPVSDDPDYNFLMSFLPYMKAMNHLQILKFRSGMCEQMLTILNPHTNGRQSTGSLQRNPTVAVMPNYLTGSSANNVAINAVTSTTS